MVTTTECAISLVVAAGGAANRWSASCRSPHGSAPVAVTAIVKKGGPRSPGKSADLSAGLARRRECQAQTALAPFASLFSSFNSLSVLIFDFTIPAGGQGQSNLEVVIEPADFHSVIKVMAATDRDAALKAMAEEMRDQLCGGSK